MVFESNQGSGAFRSTSIGIGSKNEYERGKSVDPSVGVLEPVRGEVYLPPTPLRWTLSPTLRPKTSGGSPKTTKPKHLPGRALPKPRTPSQAPRHFGLLWETWCLRFEILGLGLEVSELVARL